MIIENGSYYVIAGTSAASPSFAGVMALVVETKGGMGQGNANPALYGLLNASKSPFHPTPSGNNSVPGVTGFTAAGASYNLATGLGSVDGTALASEWGSGSSTSKPTIDFSLTPSANGGTVLAGKILLFTLSVAESGNSKNKVSFTATAPPGVTGSITPASILPGTTATVTVTAASTIAAGAKSIVLTGTDSTGTQTATYTLTVTPLPTLSLNAASPSIAVAQGASSTVGLSTVTGGSFGGSISYSLSRLPAGVTAKWSANPQTPSGSASTNSETLTLMASSTAAAGAATVVVTAAGDGLTASKSVTLQVQAAPGILLTVSPQTITLASASMETAMVTATPVGGVIVATGATGSTISITSGLPKGFTASWKTPSVTSTGSVAWTLTLTGSASAIASTSSLSLAAEVTGKTGGVYKTSGNLPMTVTQTVAKKLHAPPLQVHSGR
jgi:hypothetical protein